MNCVTLAIMLMAQSYFWKREVWMIKHLSEDNTVPYSNLPAEVGDYPEFEDAVAGYNKGAFYFALAVGFCIVVNFAMSTDVLINGDGTYNYNLGSRTVTGLLTVRMNEPPRRSAASRAADASRSCCAEHYAREHQGCRLPVIRAAELFKRLVRGAAWRGAWRLR